MLDELVDLAKCVIGGPEASYDILLRLILLFLRRSRSCVAIIIGPDEVRGFEGGLGEGFCIADFQDGAENDSSVHGGEARFPPPAAHEAPSIFQVTASWWRRNETIQPVLWRESQQAFS